MAYDISNKVSKNTVEASLRQAKILVENAQTFLNYAREAAPDEMYLGYDIDDRNADAKRLADEIQAMIDEAVNEEAVSDG